MQPPPAADGYQEESPYLSNSACRLPRDDAVFEKNMSFGESDSPQMSFDCRGTVIQARAGIPVPLPWRQPRPLPTRELTQFLVRKNSYWSTSDRSDVRWDLLTISHYGANPTVFAEIKDRKALEGVKHLIKQRLRIIDQAVRD